MRRQQKYSRAYGYAVDRIAVTESPAEKTVRAAPVSRSVLKYNPSLRWLQDPDILVTTLGERGYPCELPGL